MALSSTHTLPLYELKFRNNIKSRTIEIIILLLLLSLVGYRFLNLNDNGYPWVLALVCEMWFTFSWIIIVSTKWNQLISKTYPERLLEWSSELPRVDMFVTTADPKLEPPIMTVNTVLSLLAAEYSADKLACYVSDDAASPLTFYSLVEALKFAKLWVPFCKKYNISVRAPFRYFKPDSQPSLLDSSPEFLQDWIKIKEEYAKLYLKIDDACKQREPCDLSGEFADFFAIDGRNHKSIVKVINENKKEISGVPHLIYVAREKRMNYPHNFKAGAMNVLNRVSGLMTNAPVMLNVDCDMFANNPLVVLHAMCFLLHGGAGKDQKDYAFVQSPQHFHDGLKDDPFGNQMHVLHEFLGRGMAGIQGPFYAGTGCFHRRNVIYGSSPKDKLIKGNILENENLEKTFGKSIKLCESAAKILEAKDIITMEDSTTSLKDSIEAACQVADCAYEFGTGWGQKVGWMYGSVTEDILTGLTIHARGWETAYCTPDPPSFLGCTPSLGPIILLQWKRWSTGLFEILFSSKSPLIFTLTSNLRIRQCLAYLYVQTWALRSIFDLCYAILPAYCIVSNSSHIFPNMNEAAIMIPISIVVIYNLYTFFEYVRAGQSIRAWWNNQRMWKVISASSWLFGILSVGLKFVGLSETAFEVTKKDNSNGEIDESNSDNGRFTFNDSPMFVPGTSILLINLTALLVAAFRTIYGNNEKRMYLGEVICCKFVVIYFWTFLKGIFSKGEYGIPLTTIIKSAALTMLLFLPFCI